MLNETEASVPSGTVSPQELQNSVTVSPQDLTLDNSAPPSASTTELPTPPFHSPACFSTDPSPIINTETDLFPEQETWEPLLPADEFNSFPLDLPKPAPKPKPRVSVSPSTRTKSPSTPSRGITKPSPVSGVSGRQRKKLPEIVYDPKDPVAAKRARNTEAARKSRARKTERHDTMEAKIARLEQELEDSRRREEYWKGVAQGTS